jgi:cytoskeletal protein CcmA (bactofilin family)
MFSKHNERQASEDRLRDENRSATISPLPSTGMRDAVAMPISSEMTSPRESRSDSESVVGREDRFEGTLRVQRGLRVLGQISGTIEAATSVTIEEGATVEADLTADEAIISGEYSGKLVCRQRVEIRATGLVKGEIETVRLMLHEGGFIDGALHMQKAGTVGSGSSSSSSSSSSASGSGDSGRLGDSLRTGIAPRSTTESLATSGTESEATSALGSTELTSTGSETAASTNGTEAAAEREPAVSTRSSGSGRSSR